MNFDPKELRRLTEQAIKDAKAERDAQEAAKREKERQEIEANKANAECIVATIPALARAAALKGDGHVVIYRVQSAERNYNTWNNHLGRHRNELLANSVAQMVMDLCHRAGISAGLVRGWDDIEDWYDIVVSW